MSILRSIQINHFEYKAKRNWDKTYWALDIHGTILKPNYKFGNTPKDFYPYAIETLQFLTSLPDVEMILYTCSHPHEIDEYIKLFDSFGIKFKYVNENPEVPTDVNGYGCYDKKFYMNVLFEDKSGFDPETEWKQVLDFMKAKYGQKKPSKLKITKVLMDKDNRKFRCGFGKNDGVWYFRLDLWTLGYRIKK